MVLNRRIEANPKKIQAILEMQAPRNTKQLQQLTGRIVALSRFISQSIGKCLPFFKILRNSFEWFKECEQAFNQRKKYLASPPLLSRTIPKEVPYLDLAVMCDLALMTIFINHPLYVGFFSSSQYGTRVLQFGPLNLYLFALSFVIL